MKGLMSLLLSVTLTLSPLTAAGSAARDEDISIAAPCAVLMEKETGAVLYEKSAHERRPFASVTKIMTLLLITEDIESGKLSETDTVTASARAASFGGSCIYLEEGEELSVSDMLKCICVVSANDCAVAMAEHVSGNEETFVKRMNQRAAELGLEDTHFTNCTGLFEDGEHYSSAYDIALMSRELIRHELIKKYTTIWMDSIRDGAFELSNTNKLVYWYNGCTGLKTGYTSKAMYCLSATAEREGVEYIAVILGGESINSRNNDAKTLLNYGFANFTVLDIDRDISLPEIAVEFGKDENAALALSPHERFALVPKGVSSAEYSLSLPESVCAPLEAGTQVGELHVGINGNTLCNIPVCTAGAVESPGFGGLFAYIAKSLIGL